MFKALTEVPVPIHLYGILLALAFVTGIYSGVWHGRRLGFSTDDILDLAVWFMGSSIIGARALYIVLYPQQFTTFGSYFALHQGGMVFFGGFIATAVTMVAYARYRGWSLRNVGDMVAPSLPFAQAVGRLGCFTNGCCYGAPTTSVFGIVFPNLADNLARYPTQLFEAGFLLALGLIVSWLVRRRGRQDPAILPGVPWGVYVVSYGLFRFLIEFLRGDDRGGTFTRFAFSISQCIGLLAVLGGILWLVACVRKAPKITVAKEEISHE